MKRILLASAALLGTAMGAQAADMAAKAPYYKAPIVAVYDWTGFYVGVNAGVGIGRNRAGHSFGNNSVYLQPQGGFGGGQIGYNWRTDSLLGPIVYGLEADIQGAGLSDGYTSLNNPVQTTAYNQKTDWFGTVRGRIGIAKGPALGYITGGYAYGNVKTSVNEGGVNVFSNNQMQGGWTFGSGVEAALGGNWTGKIEYLNLHLGNKSFAFAPGGQVLNTEVRENIFRIGLNYKVGGNGAYVPAPAANWTGLYLGGNFGSGIARNRSTAPNLLGGVEQFNLAPDGFIGGGQIGYNWQASNWVYGIETDFQGSAQRDNKTVVAFGAAAYDAKLPWFGTVRGRLGYSVGSTLFYATGGYAYGNMKTKVTVAGFPTSSFSETKGGWTAGAGIETPFTLLGLVGPNWTTKTEYLYVDLGSTTSTFTAGVPFVATTSVKEHIFRTGINYHFNTPVVAKY